MMETVTIRKRKRPTGSGIWSGYSIDEDDAGRWVYTPAGSTYVGHDGRHYRACEVAQDPHGTGRDSLVLLPRDRWFVAHFAYRDRLLTHIDIATPPVAADGVWSYDDLELDPYVTAGGDFGVEDEDEFLLACSQGLVSEYERRAATDAVGWIAEHMGCADAPLVVAGISRLRDARARRLPPVHPDIAHRWGERRTRHRGRPRT